MFSNMPSAEQRKSSLKKVEAELDEAEEIASLGQGLSRGALRDADGYATISTIMSLCWTS